MNQAVDASVVAVGVVTAACVVVCATVLVGLAKDAARGVRRAWREGR